MTLLRCVRGVVTLLRSYRRQGSRHRRNTWVLIDGRTRFGFWERDERDHESIFLMCFIKTETIEGFNLMKTITFIQLFVAMVPASKQFSSKLRHFVCYFF